MIKVKGLVSREDKCEGEVRRKTSTARTPNQCIFSHVTLSSIQKYIAKLCHECLSCIEELFSVAGALFRGFTL